jgi:hypothetical protein
LARKSERGRQKNSKPASGGIRNGNDKKSENRIYQFLVRIIINEPRQASQAILWKADFL